MKDRKVFSGIGFGYFIFLAVSMGLQFLLGKILEYLRVFFEEGQTWLYLFLSVAPMYLIAFPLSLLWFSRIPACPKNGEKCGIGRFWLFFVMSISVMEIGNLTGQFMMKLVERAVGRPQSFALQELLMKTDLWAVILIAVLIGPCIEEIMFRKVLVDRVRPYGEKAACLLSGLLFALFHGNFYQFFYAFGLGLLLAYLYCKTGRLRYTIALHMMINFMGSGLVLLIMKLPGMNEIMSGAWSTDRLTERQLAILFPALVLLCGYFLALIALVVAGIVLFCLFAKKIRFESGTSACKGFRLAVTAIFNVGMILCLLATAVGFIL